MKNLKTFFEYKPFNFLFALSCAGIFLTSDAQSASNFGRANSLLRKSAKYDSLLRQRNSMKSKLEACVDDQEDNEEFIQALKNTFRSDSDYDLDMFTFLKKIDVRIVALGKLEDDDELDGLHSAFALVEDSQISCKLKKGKGFDDAAKSSDDKCANQKTDPQNCYYFQEDLEDSGLVTDLIKDCKDGFYVFQKVGEDCKISDVESPFTFDDLRANFTCKSDGQQVLREMANLSCRSYDKKIAKLDRKLDGLGEEFDLLEEQCGDCDLNDAKRRLSRLYPSALSDENLKAVEPGTGFRNVAEPITQLLLGAGQLGLNLYGMDQNNMNIRRYMNKYDTYLDHCATQTNEVCLAPNQVISPNVLMGGMGNMGYGGLNALGGMGGGGFGLNANLSAGIGLNGISPYGGNMYGFNPSGFNTMVNPSIYGGNYGGNAWALQQQNTQNMMLAQQRALAMQSMYAGSAYGGMPYNTQGLYYNNLFPNVNAYAGGQINVGGGNPWSTLNPYAYTGMQGTGYTGMGYNYGMFF